MSNSNNQSLLFKGIYEFEDPSGSLIGAKIPASGTADLYSGTTIVVKPNQCALFLYKGQITDKLFSGTHQVETENMPILTRLANWKFGFESPLRCELIFISGQTFTARRWGTPQPVLIQFKGIGPVPIRSYGNFNVAVSDPEKFYMKLMGSQSAVAISDVEEFIQGQIVELLPEALQDFNNLEALSTSYNQISKTLAASLNAEIAEFGLQVQSIQVLSALPSKEVLDAMEAKTAIKIIGSQKEYLLYKAANSLGQPNDGQANDPLQMMMGLMLGKGLLGSDYHEKEKAVAVVSAGKCANCGEGLSAAARFCPSCGKKV